MYEHLEFFFLQFDTKFASKQQRLAKIGIILWLLLSTQISQVWHTTRWDENAECDVHGLERPLSQRNFFSEIWLKLGDREYINIAEIKFG